MSNTFSISSCVYDGTSGDPNPLCAIVGTVNGKSIYVASVFFAYLAAANAANGMQAALTSLLWNQYVGLYGYQFMPWPSPIPFPAFPASSAVAQHVQGPYSQPDVIYSPALIGSWTV